MISRIRRNVYKVILTPENQAIERQAYSHPKVSKHKIMEWRNGQAELLSKCSVFITNKIKERVNMQKLRENHDRERDGQKFLLQNICTNVTGIFTKNFSCLSLIATENRLTDGETM